MNRDNFDYDIIIIGAGIAGLSAGIYAARALKKVLIIESQIYGGQIINSNNVENYPGIKSTTGVDLATNLYNQAINCGCTYINDVVEKIDEDGSVYTKSNKYSSKAIIIATGLKKRKLGLYGENDLIGKGISYCATCDGNFYREQDVAVVGGGNTALEDVLYLSNICKKVYLIHRNENFRADPKLIDKAKSIENIEIVTNFSVKEINGNDKLDSILISDGNSERKIDINGLFIAIGQIPDNIKFSNVLNLDEYGYIISKDCETNKENIFVAGDARTKLLRQLITAASDGAIAATRAINYINEK